MQKGPGRPAREWLRARKAERRASMAKQRAKLGPWSRLLGVIVSLGVLGGLVWAGYLATEIGVKFFG